MKSKDCIEALREIYAEWGSNHERAIDNLMHLVADEVQWDSFCNELPALMLNTHHHSKPSLQNYFSAFNQIIETQQSTVNEFLIRDDQLVVKSHCEFQSRATGIKFDSRKIDLITIVDGEVVKFTEMMDLDSFLSALG